MANCALGRRRKHSSNHGHQVELFFDTEGPQVQQRLCFRHLIETSRLIQEQDVWEEQPAGKGLQTKLSQWVRQQHEPAKHNDRRKTDHESGEYAANAAGVEAQRAEIPSLQLSPDDPVIR